MGDDVVALRREEDAAALAVLGAEHVWLDFADHQYLPPEARPSAATISTELRAALDADDPTAVFVPFGLGNPDHDATHQAVRLLMDDRPGWSWFCYEDAGYCHLPGLLAWRVSSLFRAGRWPTPARARPGPQTSCARVLPLPAPAAAYRPPSGRATRCAGA